MTGERPRAYADASVFGGVFDDEFRLASRAFFDLVRGGRFELVASDVVRRELQAAPSEVWRFFLEMVGFADVIEITADVLQLQEAYLSAGIVTRNWADDALHVAVASAAECDVIVSWNFRHIVHFRRIPRYNAVNTLQGFGGIAIHSPQEVIEYEGQGI